MFSSSKNFPLFNLYKFFPCSQIYYVNYPSTQYQYLYTLFTLMNLFTTKIKLKIVLTRLKIIWFKNIIQVSGSIDKTLLQGFFIDLLYYLIWLVIDIYDHLIPSATLEWATWAIIILKCQRQHERLINSFLFIKFRWRWPLLKTFSAPTLHSIVIHSQNELLQKSKQS